MIDRNGNLFLIWRRRLLIWLRPLAKASPVGLRLVKQGDVIRGRGFEAVPHLPGLGCVRAIWGRKKAGTRSLAHSAASELGAAGSEAAGPGAQAAAPPRPGAAEGPLMPAPGAGGARLGRGLRRGRAGSLRGAGAGRPSASPTPPPAGRRRPRGCWA